MKITLTCTGCSFETEVDSQQEAHRMGLYHAVSGDGHVVECRRDGVLLFKVERETDKKKAENN